MMFGWLILLRSMENLRIPQKLCYMYIYIIYIYLNWRTIGYVPPLDQTPFARVFSGFHHPRDIQLWEPVDPNQSMLLDVSRNADFMSFILYNNYILCIYIYDIHVQHNIYIYICMYIHIRMQMDKQYLCVALIFNLQKWWAPQETMDSTAGHHVARRPGRLSTSDQEGRGPAIRGRWKLTCLHETWGNWPSPRNIHWIFGVLPVESRDTWILPFQNK
jgi:hypothetical protein